MIRWFGKENGYSDDEIRSMVWRIMSLRVKENKEKEKVPTLAPKLVKAKRKLKKAA